MQNIFQGIIDFLGNKKYSFQVKALVFLSVLIGAWFINNIWGFSYYHNVKQKVNLLEKIVKIKSDTTITELDKEVLSNLEVKIISRKNIVEKFYSLFDNKTLEDDNKTLKRNQLTQMITSTWVFLILLIFTPLVPFLVDRFDISALAGTTVAFAGNIICIFSSYYILTLIPVIYSPIINYILNVLIQAFIGYFILRSINKTDTNE